MEHALWNRIFLTGQIDTAVASILHQSNIVFLHASQWKRRE